MAPAPIPTPLPAFAKSALKFPDWSPPEWMIDVLQYLGALGATDEWRRLDVRVHSLAPGAVIADDAFVTFDIQNITAGVVDSSWTTTDYTTCEGYFDTFFTSLQSYMHTLQRVTEYRWYKRRFTPLGTMGPGPDAKPKPFEDSGPPERVQVKSITGTAGILTAPQISCTLTEKTAWPQHWGRAYLPLWGLSCSSTTGRISTGNVDAIAGAAYTLYNSLQAAQFFPMVPVTQVNKAQARALKQVTNVQVDDLPDIQRRRRPKFVSYKKIQP